MLRRSAVNGDDFTHLFRSEHRTGSIRVFADEETRPRISREKMDGGQDPLVIYHSHPGTEAYFSPTDEQVAREGIWGPIVYIVASINPDADPYMKAFRISIR